MDTSCYRGVRNWPVLPTCCAEWEEELWLVSRVLLAQAYPLFCMLLPVPAVPIC
jgi:hypothetical protein